MADENGDVLWASGRTDGAGRIVDERGGLVAGEIWWKDDCSARLDPGALAHQPHYQVINRQDQAQNLSGTRHRASRCRGPPSAAMR